MRIALLHYSVPPVIGGVESVLAHHARLMADAGHDVQVIAARGEEFAPDITFTWLPLADSRHAEVLSIKAELDAGRVPPGFADLTETLQIGAGKSAGRHRCAHRPQRVLAQQEPGADHRPAQPARLREQPAHDPLAS